MTAVGIMIIITLMLITIIHFNSLLFMCRVNRYEANYRHSTIQIQVIILFSNTT
jgi:hypothetical protein